MTDEKDISLVEQSIIDVSADGLDSTDVGVEEVLQTLNVAEATGLTSQQIEHVRTLYLTPRLQCFYSLVSFLLQWLSHLL